MNNIFLSFLAGLSLNFMPCVLPILLIKIYDIIKYSQTKQSKKNLKIISISTTFGILFIFLLFSLINVIFTSTGKAFNLGFHFQNPYFLIVVIFLLFIFVLNLLNIFNFHYSPKIINYIQKKYEKSKKLNKGIFIENFVTGIFMVLFATPCSIPIIGTVATFSLTSDDNFYIIYNFLAMGFGMSIPFFLLMINPEIFNFLKNKKFLLPFVHKFIIFSLIITILWLLYILQIEMSVKSFFILLLFMIVIVLQFKIIKKAFNNFVMILIITIFGTIMPLEISKQDEITKNESIWNNNISKKEITKYINKNKTVFISITAKWCMICNLNNVSVFSKNKVLNYIKNKNAISIKIDATKDNKNAEIFYKNPNSIYLPKYIVFNKKHPNGCSFSGQLTEKEFFKKFENCS